VGPKRTEKENGKGEKNWGATCNMRDVKQRVILDYFRKSQKGKGDVFNVILELP
jgi:hypothetical protein